MNATSRSSADTARPGSDEQDAPASPAPPQGEREAFEEMRLTLIGQVHELIDIAERHCWTDDEEEKRRTQGAIDYARKVTAPYNYNGGRASLRASPAVPVAQDEREAFEALVSMCEQHGDFSNGVTDSTGAIDEGEVRASEIIRAARAALSASTPPAAVPMSQKTQDGHSTSGDLLGSYDADGRAGLRAWDDLPDALKAHPGVKAIYRGLLDVQGVLFSERIGAAMGTQPADKENGNA